MCVCVCVGCSHCNPYVVPQSASHFALHHTHPTTTTTFPPFPRLPSPLLLCIHLHPLFSPRRSLLPPCSLSVVASSPLPPRKPPSCLASARSRPPHRSTPPQEHPHPPSPPIPGFILLHYSNNPTHQHTLWALVPFCVWARASPRTTERTLPRRDHHLATHHPPNHLPSLNP